MGGGKIEFMSVGLLVFIAVVLAAISALFSGIETALFSLQPFQIKRLHKNNPRLARALEKLMEKPRRTLSAILLGDAFANLPLILLCLYLMQRVTHAFLPLWVASLVIFAIIVLLCDLGPKLIGLGQPYRVAQLGVATLRLMLPMIEPINGVLQGISEKIADALTPEKVRTKQSLSEGELTTLVELSAEEGVIEPAESEIIQEIIKLGDKTVKDCMTPRTDMFALPDDIGNEEAIAQLRVRRHHRVPVFADTPDDILGILDVKVFLMDPSRHFSEAIIPPSFVPETMKAHDLLKSFLTHRQGMAVIVDEFGGTEGIITLADLVEEIISDAVPSADRLFYLESVGPGRVLANGRARLDDLGEKLGMSIEEEGVDTIGGLIFNRLGYLPKAGATLRINDLTLTVRRASRKQVEEVMIDLTASELSGQGGEA